MDLNQQVQYIRKFNRAYTAKIGLLEKHILGSGYTLAEGRILHEINEIENCTAKDITIKLGMDPGFVSRTVASLIHRNLLEKKVSAEDKRASILKITEAGKQIIESLNEKSNHQIRGLLSELTEKERNKVCEGIKDLNEHFLHEEEEESRFVTIRNEIKPGDAGRLIALHGDLYKKECGYNSIFEGYVCKTFYEALVNGNPEKDRFWIAEDKGEIIGSVAIIAKEDGICQLRWLLVLPEYRKTGLGKKLVHEALEYAQSGIFTKIFLETSHEQETAIRMYQRSGFSIKKTYPIDGWGKPLTGIYMEKDLAV